MPRPTTPSSAGDRDVAGRAERAAAQREHHEGGDDQARRRRPPGRTTPSRRRRRPPATGSIRPVVSSQRSRWASSACRHSRAMPASPMHERPEQRAPAEHAPRRAAPAPRPSAASAIDGPTSVSRRIRPGRGRRGWRSRGRARRLEAGRRPAAPSRARRTRRCRSRRARRSRTKPTRTQSTGTPRWRASPDATPPMIGSWVSRVARRGRAAGLGGGGGAHLGSIVTQRTGRATMRQNPDPTLSPTGPGRRRIRVVPDGAERPRRAGLSHDHDTTRSTAEHPRTRRARRSGRRPRVTRDEIRDLGRLRRSRHDRKIAGVAGGLARHLDIDPSSCGWLRGARLLRRRRPDPVRRLLAAGARGRPRPRRPSTSTSAAAPSP